MFEDIINTLDSLGVTYTEDYDAGTLTIDIDTVDKLALVEIISMLNNGGFTYDIDDVSIVVYGGAEPSTTETYDEEAYLDDALAQM
jgi:hypothetical protein